MKRTLMMLTAAAALSLGASIAVAQGVVVTLEPEVRTVFRNYVVEQQVAPVVVETPLAVDTVVPAEVVLNPLPPMIVESVPDYSAYQYFVADGRIYVVDPAPRRIITVID